ncbi:MAG TPA: poly(3-hydroxyalkanoate) depolymerase [Burkholderiaceae bacterium]|nr:poly(3-hydroxyalkanoate) depolymerase [Burkholderiaceae bacterium]
MRTVEVGGQTLRVGVRPGKLDGPPLLIFNGIGANLELMEPFTAALNGIECVTFDIPGVGGSPAPLLPYRFSGLARLANRVMMQLGYDGEINVMGVSWGGALAQQFAFMYPNRCRRLVLAATSPGALMVPGRLSVVSKLISARRYADPEYLLKAGANLYGGIFRRQPELLTKHARHIVPPRGRGYLYQLLAGMGWTSLFWLRLLRQPTLVIGGNDDPIIPLINAKLLALLIRKSRLHVVDDGHLFVVGRAQDAARAVSQFLTEEMPGTGPSPQPSPAEAGEGAFIRARGSRRGRDLIPSPRSRGEG